MLRELAILTEDEAYEWYRNRRAEAIAAMMDGRISEQVGNSIIDWASDSLQVYLCAVHLGYIIPSQLPGEKGRNNERRY